MIHQQSFSRGSRPSASRRLPLRILHSYHVINVEGSCAKHLTIEFYFIRPLCCQHLYLLLLVFHYPSLFHSRLKTFLLGKSCPSYSFLFFSKTDSMESQDCLPILLSISVFSFLVFLFFHFSVVVSVR